DEHLRNAPTWRSFNEVLASNTAKSFAADARGDEADRHDEEVPVDELTDDDIPPPPDTKHRPVTFDVGDQRLTFPNERALAVWLSVQERIHKSQEPPMDDFTNKLRDLAKRAGAVAIAKIIVEDDNAYGIDEHEMTAIVIDCAKRDN